MQLNADRPESNPLPASTAASSLTHLQVEGKASERGYNQPYALPTCMPAKGSSSNKPRVRCVLLVPGCVDEHPKGLGCCGTQCLLNPPSPPLPFLCEGRQKWEVWAHGGFSEAGKSGGSVGSFSSSQWWAPEQLECRRSLLPVAMAGWKGITHQSQRKEIWHTRTHAHTIANIVNFFQPSKQSRAGGNRTQRGHNGSSFN